MPSSPEIIKAMDEISDTVSSCCSCVTISVLVLLALIGGCSDSCPLNPNFCRFVVLLTLQNSVDKLILTGLFSFSSSELQYLVDYVLLIFLF